MVTHGLFVPPIAQPFNFLLHVLKFLHGICKMLQILFIIETEADRSGIIVEHRYCGLANPGSSPQRGYKSQLIL